MQPRSTAPSGRLLTASLALGVLASMAPQAHAAIKTWDNGDANNQWDTSSLNWTGAAWEQSDSAIFGASGVGTVNLTTGITATGITFNTADYTIQGDTISFAGTVATNANATINSNIIATGVTALQVASSQTLNLGGAVTGTGALNFLSSGTTNITGTVTNTGKFHIGIGASGNPAIVSITDGAQLGSGAGASFLAVQSGGTLRYTGTTATSTTNSRYFYTNNGAANFDITQANGELTILSDFVASQHAATVSFKKSGAGTLTISSSGVRTFTQVISITGGVLGFVTNNAADIVSFNTGTAVTGAAGTTLRVSGPGTLRNNTAGVSPLNLASLDVINGARFDMRAKNSAVDALTGTGTVGNSFNSSINVAQVLTIGASNGSGTFSGSIVGNTNGQGGLINSGALSLIKTGSGTQTLTGANSYRDTTISAGTLEVGGTAGTLGQGTITNDAALLFSRTTNYTQAVAIGGTGTVTKTGAATLTLTGSNTFTGDMAVNNGTLVLASSGSLDSTAPIKVNGATLTVAAQTAGSRTLANNITLNGGTVMGVFDNMGSGGDLLTVTGGNAVHTFNSSGTLVMPDAVTANGGVIVGGGGGSGAAATGGGGGSSGGGGGGGVFALSGTTISAGSGAVTVGAGGAGGTSLGPGVAGGTSSIAGVGTAATGGQGGIGTGSGRTGGDSGTPTDLGATTYTGGVGHTGTNPRGGGGGGAGGNGGAGADSLGGAAGAGLAVDGVTYGTGGFGGTTGGASGANSGNGANSFGGNGLAGGSGIVIVQYAYVQSAGTVTLNGNIDLQSASTLDAYGNGGLLVLGGVMTTSTGSDGITLASSNNAGGVVRFDNSGNTYLGNTTINGGTTLKAGVDNALPNGAGKGNLVLDGGASAAGTFDLNGFDVAINGLSGTGNTVLGRVLNNGVGTKALTLGNGDASASFAGVIGGGTGMVALTKTGVGTQTLTGENTYTGGTTINAGILRYDNLNPDVTGALSVNSSGSLGGNGSVNAPVTLNTGGGLATNISDWTGAPGSGYDALSVASLNASSVPITLKIDTTGFANFTESNKSFIILNATGGITNFSPANVTITTTGFAGSGTWSLTQSDNSLVLDYTGGAADPYLSWVTGPPYNLAGNDALATSDPDHDGIDNLVEFVIGGNPANVSNSDLLPTSEASGSNLVFTYRRSDASAYLNPTVEYGNNLTSWTTAVDGQDGVTIDAPVDLGGGIKKIVVTIPKGANTQLFARLNVVVP